MAEDPEGQRPRALEHLDGARCLCAAWVLCCNFVPADHAGGLLAAKGRGNVPADFFVVLSGFATHWAHEPHRVRAGGLRGFYARRLGRALPLAWLALLSVLPLSARKPSALHVLQCLTFTANWADPGRFAACPNPQSWTLASLMPCWLLAPLVSRAVVRVGSVRGFGGLAALGLVLWGAWSVPLLVRQFALGSQLPASWYGPSYLWPGAMLPDFALGSVAAAMAARREVSGGGGTERSSARADEDGWLAGLSQAALGRVADACVIFVVAAAVFVASPSSAGLRAAGWAEWSTDARAGVDILFGRALSLPMAVFLVASAAGGGAGRLAALLRFPGLAEPGRYGLEVYLLQGPVFGYVRLCCPDLPHSTEAFVAGFVAVWFAAGLFSAYVTQPWSRWLLEAIGADDSASSVDGEGEGRSMISDVSDASGDTEDD